MWTSILTRARRSRIPSTCSSTRSVCQAHPSQDGISKRKQEEEGILRQAWKTCALWFIWQTQTQNTGTSTHTLFLTSTHTHTLSLSVFLLQARWRQSPKSRASRKRSLRPRITTTPCCCGLSIQTWKCAIQRQRWEGGTTWAAQRHYFHHHIACMTRTLSWMAEAVWFSSQFVWIDTFPDHHSYDLT